MQTTLDTSATSSATIEKSTLNYTDDYVNYLYRNFSYNGMLDNQIEKHLQEEKQKTDEIKEEFEYLQQFQEFKPKRKPQKFIRVGKRC